MHIQLDDNTTLQQIKDVFSDYYPYLRIEFYRKPHKMFETSQEKDLIDSGKNIGEVKKTHVSGLLEIKPLDTVADLEKEFQQRFGLSVQVLQKERDHWDQTGGLDDFTLKELNEIARNSSDEFIVSEPDSEYKEFE